jgi:SAM-dependent methyltransferase
MDKSLLAMLRCPDCGSTLRPAAAEQRVYCNQEKGACSVAEGFPLIDDQPALVVFERSVLSETSLLESAAASPIRRQKPAGVLRSSLRRLFAALRGGNRMAGPNCRRFLHELPASSAQPTVLIVGGGSVGQGTEALYEKGGNVRALCFDIYASPSTDFIADAHDIPLPDASVDGVWIQAVLEHVIEPDRAVAEIHRVLKPGGVVYAEVPFMQTVHEGPYDFTRLTDTGIRWLFRWFERIESGTVLGPGQALLWSITAALSGLLRSKKAGNLLGTLIFFWVRLVDCFVARPFAVDAACGLYFLGRKMDKPISPKEVIRSFQGVCD